MRFVPRDSFLVIFFICTNELSMSPTSRLLYERRSLLNGEPTENEHPQETSVTCQLSNVNATDDNGKMHIENPMRFASLKFSGMFLPLKA